MNDANEQWRPVVGWEGLYEVSDLGRVRGLPRRGTRGGLLKPGTKASGHLVVILCEGCVKRTRQVHQLVLEAFVGPCPDGMEGLHGDGDPSQNALGNLRYGTHAENMRDAIRHGTNRNVAKTHCKHGHQFTPQNTYTSGGGRHCRECALTRSRERR